MTDAPGHHVRRQLREFARDALRAADLVDPATGVAIPEAAIVASRVFPIAPAAVAVYTLDEESQLETADANANPRWLRRLRLVVDVVVQVDADVDNALDGLCAQVEVALAADLTMGGRLSLPAELVSTDIEVPEDAQVPMALASLTYLCEWRGAADAPWTAT